jgi:hypothetical protein
MVSLGGGVDANNDPALQMQAARTGQALMK